MKRGLLFVALMGVSWFASGSDYIFSNSFEGGFVPPTDYCDQEGIAPDWMGVRVRTWEQTFSAWDGSPKAIYPSGVSFPVAVGAPKYTYTAVPFVAQPNQSVNLYWDQVQSRPQDGYGSPRPADGMFFSISPCAGDMRAPSWVSPDLWLHDGCREYEATASILWTSSFFADPLNLSMCTLTAGKTYYLNIAPVNPTDGLDIGEHTCSNVPNSQNECHVGVMTSVGQ